MLFTKVLACASLFATAIAQARLAFTVLPSTIEAGKSVTLHWGGGDGSPVTLTLQQGTTTSLKTVAIVAGGATGTSYTYVVPKDLPDGTDYAFKIEQGDEAPNYTGMIALVGGATGSVSSASTASATSSAESSSAKSTGKAVVGGAKGKHTTESASSSSSASASVSASANATTTAAAGKAHGTGKVASASVGKHSSEHRNTTLSKATLSSSSHSSKSTAATTTSEAKTTSGSGSGAGSTTGSGTSPSSTTKTGAASSLAGNLALVIFAFAGVAYLG